MWRVAEVTQYSGIDAGLSYGAATRNPLATWDSRRVYKCVCDSRDGDQLVPSGRDDGTAVARHRTLGGFENRNDVLGVALSSGGFDGDTGKDLEAGGRREHVVLCFVRWNQAVTREIHVAVDAAVKGDSTSLNVSVPRARVLEKHPRFETVPRDDRSSKNQPKRVETGRARSL